MQSALKFSISSSLSSLLLRYIDKVSPLAENTLENKLGDLNDAVFRWVCTVLSGLDLAFLFILVGIEFARTKISFLIRFTLPSDERK